MAGAGADLANADHFVRPHLAPADDRLIDRGPPMIA
jgi:hypothetical protein